MVRALTLMVVLSGCVHVAPRAERLGEVTRELSAAPFGTGAAITVARGAQTTSSYAGVTQVGPAGTAIGPRTAFNVASVSKLLTAAAIVTLAHEGRLSLDDSVKTRLPGLTLLDAQGQDQSAQITLRMLLTHTAGLPHQPPAGFDPAQFDSSWSDEALLSKLGARWSLTLTRTPGTYAYSNLGYALLGAVIEALEQKTFALAMNRFLAGFDMEDSAFWPALLTEPAAWGRVADAPALAPEWFASRYALPFSGLWATTADLIAFSRALRRPALAEMTHATAPGHGLGPVFRSRNGTLSLEHDGSGPGFLAWFLFIARDDLAIAVVTNGGGEQREPAQRLRALVEALVNAEAHDPAR